MFGLVWSSSGCAHRSAHRSQGPLHRARHRVPDIIAQLDTKGSSTVRSCSISRSCSKVTAQSQGRRISLQTECQSERCDRYAGQRQAGAARNHDTRRTDKRADCRTAPRKRLSPWRYCGGAEGRQPAAGNLQGCARRGAGGSHQKMQDDQKRTVDQIWSRRASGISLRSPFELVTLASIVEKETGKADERPRVASVFLNRLKKGMRCNPTQRLFMAWPGQRLAWEGAHACRARQAYSL